MATSYACDSTDPTLVDMRVLPKSISHPPPAVCIGFGNRSVDVTSLVAQGGSLNLTLGAFIENDVSCVTVLVLDTLHNLPVGGLLPTTVTDPWLGMLMYTPSSGMLFIQNTPGITAAKLNEKFTVHAMNDERSGYDETGNARFDTAGNVHTDGGREVSQYLLVTDSVPTSSKRPRQSLEGREEDEGEDSDDGGGPRKKKKKKKKKYDDPGSCEEFIAAILQFMSEYKAPSSKPRAADRHTEDFFRKICQEIISPDTKIEHTSRASNISADSQHIRDLVVDKNMSEVYNLIQMEELTFEQLTKAFKQRFVTVQGIDSY